MDNRIRQITVRNVQLNPAQAEVWITVVPEHQTPTTEVRGRLMGPRCPYASTVEVAYPLRPLSPSQKPTEPGGFTQRVIIPEASLWEPQCPFLYQGPIELWQDGQRRDQVLVRHGLRSFQLKERGLHVNGRPLILHGRAVSACSEDDARGTAADGVQFARRSGRIRHTFAVGACGSTWGSSCSARYAMAAPKRCGISKV